MSKEYNTLLKMAMVWIVYILWLTFLGSTSLTIGSLFSYILLLSFIIYIFRKDLSKSLQDIKKNKKKAILHILLLFLLVWIVMLLSNVIKTSIQNMLNIIPEDDNASKNIYLLLTDNLYSKIYVIFITVIFYPIVEELIFRKSFYKIIKNPVVFVIISSLVSWTFQVLFGNPAPLEFINTIHIFFLSMFMSIILVKKKNILYAIIPRILYNIIICILRIITL